MAASKKVKTAGWAGVGIAAGVAGLTALNRSAARRFERATDTETLKDLDLPDDVVEHLFTMSDGWKIRVVERGPEEGRPFVLLHGITLSAGIWPFQVRDLADAGYRVVAVDLRGHGGSGALAPASRPPLRLTLDRVADDVFEVLENLDLRGVVLVGHSMGGMVALTMMARHEAARTGRGRISALGLVGTAARVSGSRGIPGLGAALGLAQPIFRRGAVVAAHLPGHTLPGYDLAYQLARVTFGEAPSPTQVRYTGRMTAAVPARVSGELTLELLRYDQESVLPSIALPTAVIVGDHDLLTPLAQSEVLAIGIRHATLDVLPGCGHMAMLERPTELDAILVSLADRADQTEAR